MGDITTGVPQAMASSALQWMPPPARRMGATATSASSKCCRRSGTNPVTSTSGNFRANLNSPGSSLLRLARKFPDVEVTGFVPDLRQHLLEADVAVAPIRLAGGGIHCKALEAMACGTPVVISPMVTGLHGFPGQDYLVAGSVSEYVQTIRTVLENPGLAKSLSENGRRLVVENYSWEK